MRIRWTPAAAADLQHITDYLRDRHPHYREPTVRKLYEIVRSLKDSPQRGRIGRVEGTRELLFLPLPYIAVYRIQEQHIEILRFITPLRIGLKYGSAPRTSPWELPSRSPQQ